MHGTRHLIVLVCLLLATTGTASGLNVTLDSGAGATTLADDDLDGIIDFDLIVGGIFAARGRVFEQIFTNSRFVSISAGPPLQEAVLHNVGSGEATFTITINSSSFAPLGPPLGWAAYYDVKASDTVDGIVNIPSHSLQELANGGTLPLTTLTGAPVLAPADINVDDTGVNPNDTATDLRAIYTVTLGPGDEIRLPDNTGLDGKAIQVGIFNQQFSCVDKMNNFGRKVLDQARASDAKCVTQTLKADGGNATACVDNPGDQKTQKVEAKLLAHFDNFCRLNLPPWGVNGNSCCEGGANDAAPCAGAAGCPGGSCRSGACISGAGERGANDISHDLFGSAVSISDGLTGKCQKIVARSAGVLLAGRWKTFRRCKKTNFNLIMSDVDLVAQCLGSPQPDPDRIIRKRTRKLVSFVMSKCLRKGVNPVGSAFPGACTAAGNGNFADCVSERVSCRFCLGINLADDIVPPLNCDLFDDGVANASCP